MDKALLYELVSKSKSHAIELRRRLHSHPELSGREFETSRLVKGELASLGIEYKEYPDSTAVVGLLRGERSGKTVALRADMDALPIQENSSATYRSQVDGVMHACGHDVHTAILLGTARVLSQAKDRICGNVKFLFQPAEETDGGALKMVNNGCLKDPDVNWVFGLHVDAEMECGTLRTKAGSFNASSDVIDIKVKGRKAHGTCPQQGVDAIYVAAGIIVALQGLIGRGISPNEAAVLTVGKISGGIATNIIADTAEMSIMLRTVKADTRQRIKQGIRRIAEGICRTYGAECEIKMHEGYDSQVNDAECVKIISAVADEILGSGAYSDVEYPFLGAEDFCYFCKDVRGAFYQLGTANRSKGICAPTHSAEFDVDEDAIGIGMLMQAGIVMKLIGKQDDIKEPTKSRN